MGHVETGRLDDVAIPQRPIADPACWMAKDFDDNSDWIYRFAAEDIDEIDAALARVKEQRLSILEIRRENFLLPRLSTKLAALYMELLEGRGFFLLRGFPLDRYSRQDAAAIFWGIGAYLGHAVSQNKDGYMLGHVVDLGDRAELPEDSGKGLFLSKKQNVKGNYSNSRFYFHTDHADLVGLLCLHPAESGGESSIASSVAIHNAILRQRPDLLRALYQPYWTSRQNEIQAGAGPEYLMPVFNCFDGRLLTHCAPLPIRACKLHALTPLQDEALALVEAMADDPAFHLRMQLEKGDMQFLHNHTILHTRAAYRDYPEKARRRHLVRLWLVTPHGRSLPHWFYERYGAGRRGGIYVPGMTEKVVVDV